MNISSYPSIELNQIFGNYASYFNQSIQVPFERLKQLSSNIPMIIQPSSEKKYRFVVIFRANETPYIKIVDYIQNKGFFFDKWKHGYIGQCPTFKDFVEKYKISFPTKKEAPPEESKTVNTLISNQAESLELEKEVLKQRFKDSLTKDDWTVLKNNPKEFYCLKTNRTDYPFALVFLMQGTFFNEPKSIRFRWTQEGVQTYTTTHGTLTEFLRFHNLSTTTFSTSLIPPIVLPPN